MALPLHIFLPFKEKNMPLGDLSHKTQASYSHQVAIEWEREYSTAREVGRILKSEIVQSKPDCRIKRKNKKKPEI